MYFEILNCILLLFRLILKFYDLKNFSICDMFIYFQAYAAGCNIVILAQNFERVQVIPGVCHDNVQISCVDCSTDTGKIAAAYGKLVCIFEPSPISSTDSSHVSIIIISASYFCF